MRLVAAALVLVTLPICGCISVSGRAGMASGLDDAAEGLNARQGTDFSGSVTTVGYGLGVEALGLIGLHGVHMEGTQTSTGTAGMAETLRLEQSGIEISGVYPVYNGRLFMLAAGAALGSRTTRVAYERDGVLISGDDGTAAILRPQVRAVTSVGSRLVLSAGAGYEIAFLEDPIGGPFGAPVRSGTPGPQADVTATLFFCSGCVGG